MLSAPERAAPLDDTVELLQLARLDTYRQAELVQATVVAGQFNRVEIDNLAGVAVVHQRCSGSRGSASSYSMLLYKSGRMQQFCI
jgi:hypothetical protein